MTQEEKEVLNSALILAAAEEKMEKLLSTNPGSRSQALELAITDSCREVYLARHFHSKCLKTLHRARKG